jgi:hypothetical protein
MSTAAAEGEDPHVTARLSAPESGAEAQTPSGREQLVKPA